MLKGILSLFLVLQMAASFVCAGFGSLEQRSVVLFVSNAGVNVNACNLEDEVSSDDVEVGI